MPGGLLQIAAYGAQDIYLTGNPQITFFKVVYRRHTNFALETIQNTFTGGSLSFGATNGVTIERSADLISKTYIRVVLRAGTAPAGAQWAWVSNLGHALLKSIELQIGGQRIDYYTSEWLHMYNELHLKGDQERGYNIMIGNVPALTTLNHTHDAYTLYIPLRFFFDNNVGLALPLISLQYHEVRINVIVEELKNLIVTTGFNGIDPVTSLGLSITESSFECGMVYLDTDERRRFAQMSHELLIEQIQISGPDPIQERNIQILTFNNPVKEIVWGVHSGRMANTSGSYKYLWYDINDVDNMRLIATKRFVLACAKYNGSGKLILKNTSYDTNSIEPYDPLSGSLLDLFNSIKASAVDDDPSLYNVAILGNLLTLEQASTPVSVLFAEFSSRPTNIANDGSAIYDVVVKMPFNYGLYLDGSVNPLYNGKLIVNGQDRFRLQDAVYFNYLQPYEHHTRTPSDGINVYSFAIAPEEHQPSGSFNFSRIDTAALQTFINTNYVTMLGNDSLCTVYARSYNVLRIMSGMGGLAYT